MVTFSTIVYLKTRGYCTLLALIYFISNLRHLSLTNRLTIIRLNVHVGRREDYCVQYCCKQDMIHTLYELNVVENCTNPQSIDPSWLLSITPRVVDSGVLSCNSSVSMHCIYENKSHATMS